MCKIPDNPPPRQKERGVSAPGNVGRAQNALYAHTHTAGPGPPPQAMSRRAQARRGAAQRWYRRAWRAVNAHGAHSSSL